MSKSPIYNSVKNVKLDILVFGPDPTAAIRYPTDRIGKVAQKRIDIRDWLVSEGHNAVFPEDIYNPKANPVTEEVGMMREFDFVVAIIESPGSNVELGMISTRTDFARKTHTFIDFAYSTGFAANACKLIKELDGRSHGYTYPDDLTGCHLKTKIIRTVKKIQLAKYLL